MLPGLINPNRSLAQPNQPDPNLIAQVPQEKRSLPRGFFSRLILDIVTAGAALGTGIAYLQYLNISNLEWWRVWVALLAAVLFAVSSVLEMLLAQGRGRRVGMILLTAVLLLLPFWRLASLYLLSLALVLLLFMLWGEFVSYSVIDNSVRIRFFEVVRPSLNKLITGLALIAVLLYLPQWDPERSFIPEQSFKSVFDWSARMVNQYYFFDRLKLNSTFGDFALSLTRYNLADNREYGKAGPQQKTEIENQIRTELVASFEKKWGMTELADKPVSSVFYDYVVGNLGKWRADFGDRFLMIWGIVLFLIVRGLGFLVYILVAAVSYFAYQFLMALDVIRLNGESRVKELIDYA